MIRAIVSLQCLVFIGCLIDRVYSDLHILVSGAVVNQSRKACLYCEVVGSEVTLPEIYWKKDNSSMPVKNLETASISRIGNTTKLCFDFIDEQCLGNFTCFVAAADGSLKYGNQTKLESMPFFKKAYRSQTVVEGQDITLTCRSWGEPIPQVTWQFQDEPLIIDDIRLSVTTAMESSEGSESSNSIVSTLKLREATKQNRGYYRCTALFNTDLLKSQPTLVRIKDKLDPVWPFVGLFCELLIIAAIALYFEIRRKRRETQRAASANAKTEGQSNEMVPVKTAKVTPIKEL